MTGYLCNTCSPPCLLCREAEVLVFPSDCPYNEMAKANWRKVT